MRPHSRTKRRSVAVTVVYFALAVWLVLGPGGAYAGCSQGVKPMTIYRHVSSGSSFGGNPLHQTIGLAQADRVAVLEIHWRTSKTTQVLRDIPVDRAIEVTELADNFRALYWKSLPQPE